MAHPSHGMPWAARLGPGVSFFFCIINHTKGSLFIDSGNRLKWGNSNQFIEGTNDTSLEFGTGGGTSGNGDSCDLFNCCMLLMYYIFPKNKTKNI